MSTASTDDQYVDLGTVASALRGAAFDGEILTLSDAAAATMSCCDKTDALCWTQM